MNEKIKKKKRVYFSPEFNIENWAELGKALQEMLNDPILSSGDLIRFIEKYSELSSIMEEVGAWKTIKMTQHADDEMLSKEQADFYEQIVAPAQPYFFELDKKICKSEFFEKLPQERYTHLGKIIQNEIDIFREENIPLFVKENELSSKYGEIYSKLTVEFEGEEKTLKEMDLVLKDNNRERREKAWRLSMGKMLEKKKEFEELFDEMKMLRIKIAKNAGFENYRDYMHKALGRFDYTPEDLYKFHEAIEAAALPVMKKINEDRRKELGLESLRPWDMSVDLDGKILKPFSDTKKLLADSLRMLSRIDPEFSDIIKSMSEHGLLDLDNRKGKAPGGYCISLPETGSAFIFMNAVGVQYDVQTLLHESGHSLHSFAKKDERISEYRNTPSEVAELASMSMELLVTDYLDEFYIDKNDIRKAKKEQLEGSIFMFLIVAVVDTFQHWIYLHPEYSASKRDEEYARIRDRFNAGVDWSGLEQEKEISWMKTLHIFEIPFYYIEYAISQLGAIALYKQFKENPEKAIRNYKNFMKLGYSKSVPEIYEAAGIKFDFSKEYLEEMIGFVMGELEKEV
jgi:oligoendopeptidase F